MPRKPSATIRVNVIDYGRPHLMLRYRDPATGKQHSRSSGTSSPREAERLAAQWEADINAKRWVPGERMGWQVFLDRYRTLLLPSLAKGTAKLYTDVMATFERIASPAFLDSITPVMLSEYAASLRSQPIVSPVQKLARKRSETTIDGHLRTIHSALTWAHSQGFLLHVPAFPRITRKRKAKKSPHKGRAITDAEFQTMLASVDRVVSGERIEHVRRLLWLIRLTGFRLSEALDFWWSDHPEKNHVTITAKGIPAIVLYDSEQKSHEDETLPVTRECGEWLLATPPEQRRGRVAPLPGRLGNMAMLAACEIISRIGKASGIVVEPRTNKHASAHDIRRLFVTDCLRRFSPAVVQRLARHKSIETTMSFYSFIGGEVDQEAIWNAPSRVTIQVTDTSEK